MRLSEINDKINLLSNKLIEVKKEIRDITAEYESLKLQRRSVEMNYFKKWLQVDQIVELDNYKWFQGVETTKDKNINKKAPHFRRGDKIQIIKINDKSIVVKCVKGLFENRTFRIEVDSFFSYIMEDFDIHQTFNKWMVRTESLELLDN